MNIPRGRRAFARMTFVLLGGGALLSACATSPPVPIRSLADIAGTWQGLSTYGAALKVVVTGGGADFYFNGDKKVMEPPTIEADGTVKMRFAYDRNGYILLRLDAGKVVWYYKGAAGESNSVLVAAADIPKIGN